MLGRPEPDGPPTVAELAELLAALSDGESARAHAEEIRRMRTRYDARFDALAAIEAAVARLREITSPGELLVRAPRELVQASALRRAVLSVTRNGRMVAEAIHFADDAAGALDTLRTLRADPPRLEHPLIETELLRRRRATIVTGVDDHPRVDRGWATTMGWSTYVAAPLVVRGDVIGVLHADAGDRPLEVLDGDVVWAFARGVAAAYETALLRRAIRRQGDDMRRFVEWLGVSSGALADAPLTLTADPPAPAAPPGRLDVVATGAGVDDRVVFEQLLTRRELEVLRLLAQGETNHRIAAQLVIAEATVKSHVVRILRKLRAGNRAEAASRYHRLTRRREEAS